MKKIIITILILASYFLLPLYSNNNWVHIKDTFYKNFQKAIYFDSLHYGAFGLAINGIPKFYLTTDGGNSWYQTLTDDICFLEPEIRRGNIYLNDVSKSSDGFVYIACDTGYFIYSDDGCLNWKRFKSGIDSNFKFIHMLNRKTGIVATEFNLFITDDGCYTFKHIPISNDNVIAYRIWDIRFVDENHIFIVAASSSLPSNMLFKTSNQGATWENISFGNIETGRLHNVGLENIWLVAPVSTLSNGIKKTKDLIYYSNDYGNTWTLQYSNQKDNHGFIMNVNFYDAFNGIATGWYGLIYMTFDGGLFWQQSYHRQYYLNENLFACLRISPNQAIVFSDKGHIYKYEIKEMSISSLILDEVYINYLSQSEYLEINFDRNTFRTNTNFSNLSIFNALGQCIVNQQISSTNSQFFIDVSHLPPGVYFVRVGSRAEKFVKW